MGIWWRIDSSLTCPTNPSRPRQLLKNKLVGQDTKKKKKKKRRGEDGASSTASSSEDEEEGDGEGGWAAEAGLGMGGKPLTEFEKIQQGRKKLPVFRYREEILAAVRDHQVGVVAMCVHYPPPSHTHTYTHIDRAMPSLLPSFLP